MRYVILGAGGFVGRNLFKYLKSRDYNVIGFEKSMLDFTRPLSFSNYTPEEGDIYIDCVSKIDGDPLEIRNVNYTGLQAFISYLQQRLSSFTYIYLSTCAILFENLVQSNAYVNSKFQAESFLRKNVPGYKILRLIFPFGRGESKSRLISRLINRVKMGESLAVDRLTLNLTPIDQLMSNFETVLASPVREINFSNDQRFFLPDIVRFISEKLEVQPEINVVDRESDLIVDSTIKIEANEDEVWNEITSMIYE